MNCMKIKMCKESPLLARAQERREPPRSMNSIFNPWCPRKDWLNPQTSSKHNTAIIKGWKRVKLRTTLITKRWWTLNQYRKTLHKLCNLQRTQTRANESKILKVQRKALRCQNFSTECFCYFKYARLRFDSSSLCYFYYYSLRILLRDLNTLSLVKKLPYLIRFNI